MVVGCCCWVGMSVVVVVVWLYVLFVVVVWLFGHVVVCLCCICCVCWLIVWLLLDECDVD